MSHSHSFTAAPDDNVRYQRLLHGVLLTVLLLSVLSFMGLVASDTYSMSRAAFFPVFLGVIGLSYFQLKHSVQRGVSVLIVGLWGATSAITILFAGVHSANLLIYPFLIVLTGWLLGTRWLMGIAGSTIALVMALGVLEFQGYYHPSPRAGVVFVTLTLVSTLVAISFLTAVAYRSLSQKRDQAYTLAQQMAQQNMTLAQRERDLQMIMSHVSAGLASFDASSRLRFGNQRYAALFGAQPEQLVGRHITEYMPQAALDLVMPHWNQCLAGGRAEYRRINRDPLTGEPRILDVALEPEYHEARVTGLFALLIDVTEEVAAEEHIKELNATLEKRVELRTQELHTAMDTLQRSQEELARSETRAALNTLIASVTHELSTPLGNSLMVATTLVCESDDFQKAVDSNQLKRSDLHAFTDAVRSGNDLLLRNLQRATDLLSKFKQVANDQASEQRRSFDLATVVKEVVDTLAPSLKRHPHRIVLAIPEGITMDSLPGPLGQIIINLTNNAYLHAFEGRSDGVLTLSASTEGESVLLCCEDNGVGISEDNLQHLFEPFFSTKKGQGGTGLGMGIVENLVRKTLGGSLRMHSELGVGTRVEVHLPRVAPLVQRS